MLDRIYVITAYYIFFSWNRKLLRSSPILQSPPSRPTNQSRCVYHCVPLLTGTLLPYHCSLILQGLQFLMENFKDGNADSPKFNPISQKDNQEKPLKPAILRSTTVHRSYPGGIALRREGIALWPSIPYLATSLSVMMKCNLIHCESPLMLFSVWSMQSAHLERLISLVQIIIFCKSTRWK